jgi:hypothetical protein
MPRRSVSKHKIGTYKGLTALITERRMLGAMLRRLDNTGKSWLASRCLPPILWLAISGYLFLLLRYGNVIGDMAVVVCAALVGNLSCLVLNRRDSARAWWFHRWLCELGVGNIVVDPASIEVNRRARQAKTDRLDADKLLAMLIRRHAGERVWCCITCVPAS